MIGTIGATTAIYIFSERKVTTWAEVHFSTNLNVGFSKHTQTKRLAAADLDGEAPSDSSAGRAMETPIPRRKFRRFSDGIILLRPLN